MTLPKKGVKGLRCCEVSIFSLQVVDESQMAIFSNKPTSPRIQNTRLVRDGWQIQFNAAATFLIVFRAQTNILFIIKERFSCSLNGHIGPPKCVDY
jgi:hypothetical protein